MKMARFTPWVVFACIGTLAGCTSGEGGPAGNTELNVLVPPAGTQSAGGPQTDVQSVEYTINCLGAGGENGPFLGTPGFDDAVQINGNLEVQDERLNTNGNVNPPVNSDGTPGVGPSITDEITEVWQGFMDLPPGSCTVQLRARDSDGEVICSTNPTSFTVVQDTTTKVNQVLLCGVSFQAPVGMLDLDASFSFEVANYCPNLFVLNCFESDEVTALGPPIPLPLEVTECEVRYDDGDDTCGNSCDPQDCFESAEGLTCIPAAVQAFCNGGDAPGAACALNRCNGGDPSVDGTPCTDDLQCQGTSPVADGTCDPSTNAAECGGTSPIPDGTCVAGPTTTVTCTGAGADGPATNAIDCDGSPFTSETECSWGGEVLGSVGQQPYIPNGLLAALSGADSPPAAGTFFVNCSGDTLVGGPNPPLDPGAVITCTATTTDGDTDCNKTKVFTTKCLGNTPCEDFALGGGTCDDGTICTADSCNEGNCDGVDPNLCCDNDPTNTGEDCSSEIAGSGICGGPGNTQPGVCVSTACANDDACDDQNQCTTTLFCDEVGTGILGSGFCCADANIDGCTANEMAAPLVAGTPCTNTDPDDGVCDGIDTCIDIVCDDTILCPAPDTVCQIVSCDNPPIEGVCNTSDVADGACSAGSDNPGDPCTADADCPAGTCEGETPCSTCVGGTAQGSECNTTAKATACTDGGGACTASACGSGSCKGEAPDLPADTMLIPNACRVGGAGGDVLTELPLSITLDPTPITSGGTVDVTLVTAEAPVAASFLQAAVNLIGALEVAFIGPFTLVTTGPATGGALVGTTELDTSGYTFPGSVVIPLESSDGAPGNTSGTYNCYQTQQPPPPDMPSDTKVLGGTCVGGANAGSCCVESVQCPAPADCGAGSCEPIFTGTKACGASCGLATPTSCADPDGPAGPLGAAPLVIGPALASFTTATPNSQTFDVTGAGGTQLCFETVGGIFTAETFIDVSVDPGGFVTAPIFCGPGTLNADDTINPLTDAERLCFPITAP